MRRALLAIWLILGACGRSASEGADPTAPAGIVEAVDGEVSATRAPAAPRRLVTGAEVWSDDVVTTTASASVAIRLRHNGVLWRLEGGLSRRVDQAVAWRAPRETGGGGGTPQTDRTAAAGRHAEQEAGETGATAAVTGSAPAAAPAVAAAPAQATPTPESAPSPPAAATPAPTPPADPTPRAPAKADPAPRAEKAPAPTADKAPASAADKAPAPAADKAPAPAAETGPAPAAAPAQPSPPPPPPAPIVAPAETDEREEAAPDAKKAAKPKASRPRALPRPTTKGAPADDAPGAGGANGGGAPSAPSADIRLDIAPTGEDPAADRRVVSVAQSRLRACTHAQLAADPLAQGRVRLRVEIAAGGQVTGVATESVAGASAETATCLQQRLRSLVFPAATARAVVVTVTFASR